MPKIVDPDSLNQGVEVTITTATKLITLTAAGNLSNASPGATSGVTMQALYSFLKEEWKTDSALNKFKFPLKSYTKNEFLWINGWAPANAATRNLIRDAGWQESVGAASGDLYAGMISLGSFNATGDQGYYSNIAGLGQTSTNFNKTGNVNEAILVRDADGTDFRTYLKAFLRIQGKLYSSYDLLVEQGIASLEATLYRFPLANSTDLNIVAADATIDANTPYTGMSLAYYSGVGFTTWANATVYPAKSVVKSAVTNRWFFTNAGGTSSGTAANLAGGSDTAITWVAYNGERLIGTTYYAFNIAVDGNVGTRAQIYEWTQRQLRKTVDINTGTIADPNQDAVGVVKGNLANEISAYRGSDLILKQGVYVDDFAATEVNNIVFVPIPIDSGTPAEVTFPFSTVVTLNMPTNVVNEVDANVRGVAYFLNDDAPGANAGNDFDTSGAIIVQDNTPANVDFDGTDLVGNAYTFSYAYDTNNQRGGASATTDAPVVLQLCGIAGFENGTTEFTITRTPNLTVNIVASDERNYANA
jgi:hypothetical protein